MSDEVGRKVLDCPNLNTWPDIEEILKKRKPGTISLFKIAYTTAGNTQIDSLPIQAAILCFIINCILIDDVLDDDEKGIWKTYGVGRAVNLAAALHARQQILIHESKFSDGHKLEVICCLNQMKLLESEAQELATQNKIDVNQYWNMVHGKSGNVCGTSMRIGALLGGASQSEANILYSIGKKMGEVGQISNDLRGAFQIPANPDWKWIGSSLPILLSLGTSHPYLDEFKEILTKNLSQNNNLERAHEILIKSNSISLCCDHITQRLEDIYQGLCKCLLPGKEHLRKNIGEDVKHAIDWVRDLNVDLSEETTKALNFLDEKLSSHSF